MIGRRRADVSPGCVSRHRPLTRTEWATLGITWIALHSVWFVSTTHSPVRLPHYSLLQFLDMRMCVIEWPSLVGGVA